MWKFGESAIVLWYIKIMKNEKYWQKCLELAKKADRPFSYFGRGNSLIDVRYNSSEELINDAKNKLISFAFARSNPLLLNERRAIEVSLNVNNLENIEPSKLDELVDEELINKYARIFYNSNNPLMNEFRQQFQD